MWNVDCGMLIMGLVGFGDVGFGDVDCGLGWLSELMLTERLPSREEK